MEVVIAGTVMLVLLVGKSIVKSATAIGARVVDSVDSAKDNALRAVGLLNERDAIDDVTTTYVPDETNPFGGFRVKLDWRSWAAKARDVTGSVVTGISGIIS